MEKTSKIKECIFKNAWNPPTGGTLYIHDLTLENGDKGTVYHNKQTPDDIAGGSTITYTINDKNKITIIRQVENPAESLKKPFVNNKQLDILGLSFSYAKDLLVAQLNNGIKFKDISAELIKHGGIVYKNMQELKDASEIK